MIGHTGRTGPSGPIGKTGLKTAILKLNGQWHGLMCIESPVAWFLDVARLTIAETDGEVRAPVDPLFVRACEPGSIRVLSTQPDAPLTGTLGAFVSDDNQVVVRCPPGQGTALSVTVTLAGARKGATDRFPVYSEEQARRNEAFWDQAVRGNGKARRL